MRYLVSRIEGGVAWEMTPCTDIEAANYTTYLQTFFFAKKRGGIIAWGGKELKTGPIMGITSL